MLNNRRRVIILLIILMTSVFLSCGISVPYTIEASITFSQDTVDPNSGTININTEEIDSDSNITLGPSLVLIYGYYSSSDTESIPGETIKQQYLSTINNTWNTKKLPVVNMETSNLLFTETLGGQNFKFYLFSPFYPEKPDDTKLSGFNYHYNLEKFYNNSRTRITAPDITENQYLKLTIQNNKDSNPTITLNDVLWRVNPYIDFTDKTYHFYIFAAITSGNGSFNYTTELSYLTSFTN